MILYNKLGVTIHTLPHKIKSFNFVIGRKKMLITKKLIVIQEYDVGILLASHLKNI